MARVVNEYDCGVVSEDFNVTSMAKKLNALTNEQVYQYKQKSHKAAYVLNAQTNKKLLLDIINNLTQ